ncbi:unnamed protein product [Cylindrotheca closterium]|uniref:Uncharacterized protein n=1 Tax=Cylindrotheca closterium TaxID=2856 RepID=A0AAD2PXR7_9STRA|nr:unnamed protein product [Cylindrotheca closterium]
MLTFHQQAFPFLRQSNIPFNNLSHLQSAVVSTTTSTSLHALPKNPLSRWASDSALELLSAASSIRGGAAATKVALDMAKETQHLAVLSSYGVLSVLILNSALRLYTSTKFKRNPSDKNDWVLPNLFAFCAGTCVITGAFTGIMFQLLGIYHKSALSMGNHVAYLAFKESTEGYLQLGFRTFLTCLGSFVATFLINFRNMTDEDERFGNGLFSMMAVFTLLGGIVLRKVLHLATVHIFAPLISV